jgi:hypothetical protein
MVSVFCNPAGYCHEAAAVPSAPKNGSPSVFALVNYKYTQNVRRKMRGIQAIPAGYAPPHRAEA